MKIEELPSGLVVPADEPKEPPRDPLPLEFTHSEGRSEVSNAISVLWKFTGQRGAIFPERRGRQASRRAIVKAMAIQFLGPDANFEEWT